MYRNRAYGDAVVALEGDHLTFQFHTFKAALTRFQYDTFVSGLRGFGGKTRPTFYLNEDEDVAKLSAEGLEFEQVNARPED